MTDLDAISKLYAHAANLERGMRYADASDAFLVIADAEEERGEADAATSLRRQALRNYVAAWARQRWPREDIFIENIDIAQFSPRARRSRIDLAVRRCDAGRWERVSVGRRGDVRLEEADLGGGKRHQNYRAWIGRERQPWQRGDDGEE